MFRTVLGLILTTGSAPYEYESPPLAIHVAQELGGKEAAELAQALRQVCRRSKACRDVAFTEASTLLRVSAARSGERFYGVVQITSRVLTPGSISSRDRSIHRLAERLVEALRERQRAEPAVVEMPANGMAR